MIATTSTLERYITKHDNTCTRCQTKTEFFNDYFRRCPNCANLYRRSDSPEFISRSQAMLEHEAKKKK
jgi:anaerobic ribonucleoside-triphosphate reductase